MNEQSLNIKLVGEVEKHPELFNYQLSAYSRIWILQKNPRVKWEKQFIYQLGKNNTLFTLYFIFVLFTTLN